MYKLDHFTEKNTNKIIAFIKANSFALVTGFGDEYPVATQIPLEIICIADKLFLTGHIMKKTDHHLAFAKDDKVLVVFSGPHCYVSASWYNNPQSASTWNYMTVQAKGKIIFTDEEGTYKAIQSLTGKYEETASSAAFNKMPKAYVMPMLKAIIGFTIEVESLAATFKLSQNKQPDEQRNIIHQLRNRGDEQSVKIAGEMENLIII